MVLTVPSDSTQICYGVSLVGSTGEAWVDSARLQLARR